MCCARFAIRNTTQSADFKAMAMPTAGFLFLQKSIVSLKELMKYLLGNNAYHWLYTLKAKGRE